MEHICMASRLCDVVDESTVATQGGFCIRAPKRLIASMIEWLLTWQAAGLNDYNKHICLYKYECECECERKYRWRL